jgi:hypothetical protein
MATASGSLSGISINHLKFFSSSTTQHKGWSIINISTRLRVFSKKLASPRSWLHNIINTKLASQHEAGNTSSTRSWHHSTRLATYQQHEAWHHSTRLATHHQHEVGNTTRGWQHIISMKLASQHRAGNTLSA